MSRILLIVALCLFLMPFANAAVGIIDSYDAASSTITIKNWFGVNEVAKLQLIDNGCHQSRWMGDARCTALIKVNSKYDLDTSEKDYAYDFIKQNAKMGKMELFYLQKTETKEDYECIIGYKNTTLEEKIKGNFTYPKEAIIGKCQRSKVETKEIPISMGLIPQGEYYIRITGILPYGKSEEWIPTFYGEYLPQWAFWYNTQYGYREAINITNNNASVVLEENSTITFSFDHGALVSAGKSMANGSDIRIVWMNDTELDRINVSGSFNAPVTIAFRTQENISAGASNWSYFMYYGNPTAGKPPTDLNRIYYYYDDFSTDTTSRWQKTGGVFAVFGGLFQWSGFAAGDNAQLNTTLAGIKKLKNVKSIMNYNYTGYWASTAIRVQGDNTKWQTQFNDLDGGTNPATILTYNDGAAQVAHIDGGTYMIDENVRYNLTMRAFDNNISFYAIREETANDDAYLAAVDNNAPQVAGSVGLWNSRLGGIPYIALDWMIIMRATDSEPSLALLSEETAPTAATGSPPNVTVRFPAKFERNVLNMK